MLVPQKGGRLVLAGAAGRARDAADALETAVAGLAVLTTAEERQAYPDLVRALNRLADLLLAIAFDPTIADRVKGSPKEFSEILARLIENASKRQLAIERTDLEQAFKSVANAAVVQMPDDDPSSTSIARHQWLIIVPPESWEAVLSVAAERGSRRANVPISVGCGIDDTLLPIAARLSTTFPAGLLPLGLESVEFFASNLGKSTVVGPVLGLVSTVAQKLVLASWENARAAMRPVEWPVPEADPIAHLAEAEQLLDAVGLDEREVLAVMHDLVVRVGRELEGRNETPLAAELAGPALVDSTAVDDAHAMSRVSKAVELALDLELNRAASAGDRSWRTYEAPQKPTKRNLNPPNALGRSFKHGLPQTDSGLSRCSTLTISKQGSGSSSETGCPNTPHACSCFRQSRREKPLRYSDWQDHVSTANLGTPSTLERRHRSRSPTRPRRRPISTTLSYRTPRSSRSVPTARNTWHRTLQP